MSPTWTSGGLIWGDLVCREGPPQITQPLGSLDFSLQPVTPTITPAPCFHQYLATVPPQFHALTNTPRFPCHSLWLPVSMILVTTPRPLFPPHCYPIPASRLSSLTPSLDPATQSKVPLRRPPPFCLPSSRGVVGKKVLQKTLLLGKSSFLSAPHLCPGTSFHPRH